MSTEKKPLEDGTVVHLMGFEEFCARISATQQTDKAKLLSAWREVPSHVAISRRRPVRGKFQYQLQCSEWPDEWFNEDWFKETQQSKDTGACAG